MQKDIINIIIKKYFESNPSRIVNSKFRQWFLSASSSDKKEEALRSVWNQLHVKPDESTLRDLNLMHKRINAVRTDHKHRVSSFSWIVRIAAACLLILLSAGSTYYFTTKQPIQSNRPLSQPDDVIVECLSPVDDTKEIKLPDGTRALLNKSSILIYNNHYNQHTRTVYLVGQANFKVTKNPNKPFIVKASNVSVRALGTEFDVKAYPDQLSVTATLLHGKVKVNCVAGSSTYSYLLNPNQRVVYRKDSMRSCKQNVDVRYVSSWAKKRLVFKDVPITQIFDALEQYDNVSIAYDIRSLNRDKYNVTFRHNQPTSEKLKILQNLSGDSFAFEQDGNKIRIITN